MPRASFQRSTEVRTSRSSLSRRSAGPGHALGELEQDLVAADLRVGRGAVDHLALGADRGEQLLDAALVVVLGGLGLGALALCIGARRLERLDLRVQGVELPRDPRLGALYRPACGARRG